MNDELFTQEQIELASNAVLQLTAVVNRFEHQILAVASIAHAIDHGHWADTVSEYRELLRKTDENLRLERAVYGAEHVCDEQWEIWSSRFEPCMQKIAEVIDL